MAPLRLTIRILLVGVGLVTAPAALAQSGDATSLGLPDRAVVLRSETRTVDGQQQVVYEIRFTSGAAKGRTVTIGETSGALLSNGQIFPVGADVYVSSIQKIDGTTQYLINDYDRRSGMWWLVAIFVAAVVWFSRWRGTRSLLSLAFSLFVIIGWIVPLIATGSNPVTVTIFGSAAILIVGFLLTEGWSRLTLAAAVGTTVTMAVIGGLSAWAIALTRLTGNASEEAFYLQGLGAANIDLRGLLLAGIIIGTLGILDDMAVSQAATVGELRRANPRLTNRQLYQSALHVGRTHLAAIINTLTLAYAGSALPLLVLFNANPQPASLTLNGENIATEIVRSVVGSLGLILALPITTAGAVLLKVNSSAGHPHLVEDAPHPAHPHRQS